jgi:hypothetical protein
MKRVENRNEKVSYNVQILNLSDIPRKNKKSGMQQPSLPKDLNDVQVMTS